MSDLSILMKFEFLPNEMLMECFKYLNALDIFYSFDLLNYRFSRLIRNIPLHVDFQCIRKSFFDKFCIKMLLNPEIKNQIYSLHLSDKDTCGQINAFLSFFSFNEFSNLQSLTLNENKNNNVEILEWILPLSPKLHSLISKRLFDSLTLIDKISSVKKLTISKCQSKELCQILQCMPMLNCLNIENFSIYYESINNETCCCDYIAWNLKRLIIDKFQNDFEDFEKFIKQIPNLKSLTISTDNKLNMFDAYRWENLISSSLPYLNIFNIHLYNTIHI
ncbi:unnamed protein product [Rotaria sordida]|uniref:F-box domain-containing protein n=1 Tax=Rotaria sordida TaxID=392033 RepID=A0A815QNL1_9BILA|nr:unnamed protein product [Rotaria sordida]CAF1643195.1 unnamed protein product [Rotaria sordida]